MEAAALSDDALLMKVLIVFGRKRGVKSPGERKKQITNVIKTGLSFKEGINVKERLGLSDKRSLEQ